MAVPPNLVPQELLDTPRRGECRGTFRDLAAFLIDGHLRRLTRMRQPIDLCIATHLRRVEDSSGYLELGFARLFDYATERLGLPARRVQTLLALARGVTNLPRVADAFEHGQVTLSQVQLLLRVARSDTEAHWLTRCASGTVRSLEREVRAALKAAADSGVPGVTASGGAVAGADPHPRGDPLVGDDPVVDDDPVADGEFVGFAVPSIVHSRWSQALDLARRVSGAGDPTWRSVECIAAEYLSGGAGPGAGLTTARDHGEIAPGGDFGIDDEAALASCRETRSAAADDPSGIELFESVIAGLEAEAPRGSLTDLNWIAPPERLRDDAGDSGRVRDAKIRELLRLRQDITWNLGRLLRIFVDRRLYLELGFRAFSRYCRERLGVGVRRAWNLVALDRRLLCLPRVTAAYRAGEISWLRASALARVATEFTETLWLRLATSVTVRRLNEEIEIAEAAKRDGGQASVPRGIDSEGRVQLLSPRRAPGERASTYIRFWAPRAVATLWHAALDECRHRTGSTGVGALISAILDHFIAAWSVRTDAAWRRRYRVFERDGWRCRVPGCTSRSNLQTHHVVFRSRGGADDDANLVVLCATHHLQGIHRGRLACHLLPDGLLAWEFAPAPGTEPLARFVEDVTWQAARRDLRAQEQNDTLEPRLEATGG